MATIGLADANLGTSLSTLLTCDEILPGHPVSYQLCKTIYAFHPLGRKMTDTPILGAQSLPRDLAISKGPEKLLKERFASEWKAMNADNTILQLGSTARTYGIASMGLVIDGVDADAPIEPEKLAKQNLVVNVFDPLNTAGSLVLNQDPNALDFQKHSGVTVDGKHYHRSRSVVLLNENPVYIEYSSSAFGFVGRSVYQRALYPMKSFVQTMVTDDMVSRKAGVLIAKIKAAGPIIDAMLQFGAGIKRSLLKEARTDNVISVGNEDSIESLNLQNIDGAHGAARKNIIENIASACDMPAKMLSAETLAVAFAEGEEDAKVIVTYLESVRVWLQPAYDFMDEIVCRRAWNQEFYETVVQEQFPKLYGKVDYNTAYYEWRDSMRFTWPSLLIEPESEKAQTEDVKQKAAVNLLLTIGPRLDPDNLAMMIEWVIDTICENKTLFPHMLQLDYQELSEFLGKQQEQTEQQSAQAAAMPPDSGGGKGNSGAGITKPPPAPSPSLSKK